jgi:hypothetical protein
MPAIIDITRARGIYVKQPSSPGLEGFQISNAPSKVLRELTFSVDGAARTVELVYLKSRPSSVYARVSHTLELNSIILPKKVGGYLLTKCSFLRKSMLLLLP